MLFPNYDRWYQPQQQWWQPWVLPGQWPWYPQPPVSRWRCPDCGHWIASTIPDHACFKPYTVSIAGEQQLPQWLC
jgi:hypothetical protein